LLLCYGLNLFQPLPARRQSAGDVSANTGGPLGPNGAGRRRTRRRRHPRRSDKGFLASRLESEGQSRRTKDRKALTDEPNVSDKTTPVPWQRHPTNNPAETPSLM